MSIPADSKRVERRRALLCGLLLSGLIGLIYAASVQGAFLWDDDAHITANPCIIGPLGLKEIWTTGAANYFPLVLTNFWLGYAMWGANPAGYHVVTIACHMLAAVLLWRVLLRLRVPGAWLGAAIWALHPVQVESVAWICELKNTQSAVFFLASILCYLRWLPNGSGAGVDASASVDSTTADVGGNPSAGHFTRWYVLALVSALMAIASKGSTVMLPVALGLCVWWCRGRLTIRDTISLAPFFALSALAAGWTIWDQSVRQGATGGEWSLDFLGRIAVAGRLVWFYLGKLVWPAGLSFIYPRWSIDTTHGSAFLPVIAAVALLAVLWVRRGSGRPVLFAAAYFIVSLFPVLGFFNVYFFRYSFAADHFQYLASMGPLALLGAAWVSAFPRRWPWLSAPLLLVACVLTWQHSLSFRNNDALWRMTIARNPNSHLGWLSLGADRVSAGRYQEAIPLLERARTLKPDSGLVYNNLGIIEMMAGRFEAAVPLLERAVALSPRSAEAQDNLGHALRECGRFAESIAHHREALRLAPGYPVAANNLGCALLDAGRPDEALAQFELALRGAPAMDEVHHNMGNALQRLGRFPEAIAHYEDALRLNPKLAETHEQLANALMSAGRTPEAIQHYRRAVELRPGGAGGRVDFGRALGQSGQLEEALAQFDQAARLAPDNADAQLGRGSALSGLDRWDEARTAFERAVQLRPDSAEAHIKLAMALANTGGLEPAVREFDAALRLQPENAEAHAALARLLTVLGRTAEAEAHRARAAAASKPPPVR